MMMDQDSAFMLSLMSYVLKKLGINIKTVGPYNHKSLQAEWHKILVEYTIQMFDRSGADMAQILSLAIFAYNIFHTPNLGNYSPYQLVFGQGQRYSLT